MAHRHMRPLTSVRTATPALAQFDDLFGGGKDSEGGASVIYQVLLPFLFILDELTYIGLIDIHSKKFGSSG